MFLETLHLQQFRNYRDQQVAFRAAKTILVGENAQGKSNLLEAVELLSTLKSHRVSRDRDLVFDGESEGRISATVLRNGTLIDLGMILRQTGRRTVQLNSEVLRRHLDLLGSLNTVQFSCLDLDLVRGAPVCRRDWLDRLVIQLEPVYAHLQQQYQQVLRQRNALLRRAVQPTPTVELAIWDAQLAALGVRVQRRRARALERLQPLAQHWHALISGRREQLSVSYAPNVAPHEPGLWEEPERLQQRFLSQLQERAIAERMQATSLVGPHRDDVDLLINGNPARVFGSQGQQRTLVLALKLAELELIEDVVGEPPLLLLDDVLAELDLQRQNQLLEAVQSRFQTLITTTHLAAFDSQWLADSQVLTVESGRIQPAAAG